MICFILMILASISPVVNWSGQGKRRHGAVSAAVRSVSGLGGPAYCGGVGKLILSDILSFESVCMSLGCELKTFCLFITSLLCESFISYI